MVPPSQSAITALSASRAARPTCTNPTCPKPLRHLITQCWEPGGGNVGGREKFLLEKAARQTATAKPSTLIAEIIPPDDDPFANITEVIPDPVSPLAAPVFLPMNEDFLHTCYLMAPLLDLQFQQPLVFASIEQRYNTILDSGCTNHIIKDCLLFWTYNPSLAVPVKTANCGVLSTLAHGDVCC